MKPKKKQQTNKEETIRNTKIKNRIKRLRQIVAKICHGNYIIKKQKTSIDDVYETLWFQLQQV